MDATPLESGRHPQQYLQNRGADQNNNLSHTVQRDLESTIRTVIDMFDSALKKTISGDVTTAQQIITKASSTALASTTQTHESENVAIRIHILGRFSILIDGKDTVTGRRSSPRALELLKCIIALGSRQVNQYRIMACLWPEMNGDTAMNVFSTTLNRLRKLLGYKEAVILKSGQLTLNPNCIWVDIWQLERNLSSLSRHINTTKHNEVIEFLFEQIVQAYHGPFMGEGNDHVWSIGYKERLNKRMLKMFVELGKYWQKQDKYAKAQICFEQGILLDPLHESFYQYLMKSYIAQHRLSDAAHVYHQCRKKLSKVLGVLPSPETINIYNKINMK